MKEIPAFKDSRLLEALDYIDRDLIAEVIDDIKAPDMSNKYIPGKVFTFKNWRQFVSAALVLILLSFAFPTINIVTEIFRSGFTSGWESTTNVESSITEPNHENSNDVTNECTIASIYSEEELISAFIEYQAGDNISGYNIIKTDYLDNYTCAFDITCNRWGSIEGMDIFEFINGYLIPCINKCVRVIYDGKRVYSFSEAYNAGVIDIQDLQLLGQKVDQTFYGENELIDQIIEDYVHQYGYNERSKNKLNFAVSYFKDLGNNTYSLYIYYNDLATINATVAQTIIDGYKINNKFGGTMLIYKSGSFYPLIQAYKKGIIDISVIRVISENSK